MADCVISCVQRNGKAVAFVTWHQPLETGETSLPVTTFIDDEGDAVDIADVDVNKENPLSNAVAVIAGPDAEGYWLTIDCKGEFKKFS